MQEEWQLPSEPSICTLEPYLKVVAIGRLSCASIIIVSPSSLVLPDSAAGAWKLRPCSARPWVPRLNTAAGLLRVPPGACCPMASWGPGLLRGLGDGPARLCRKRSCAQGHAHSMHSLPLASGAFCKCLALARWNEAGWCRRLAERPGEVGTAYQHSTGVEGLLGSRRA